MKHKDYFGSDRGPLLDALLRAAHYGRLASEAVEEGKEERLRR